MADETYEKYFDKPRKDKSKKFDLIGSQYVEMRNSRRLNTIEGDEDPRLALVSNSNSHRDRQCDETERLTTNNRLSIKPKLSIGKSETNMNVYVAKEE